MKIDKKVDIREIATRTDGKNGADLYSICMEAGMFAIRSDHDMVTLEDFERSIEKFSNDFERNSLINTSGAMFA